ncbi:hypothetical protein OKA05_05285 [Luteolibacter arcticus]|uniref:Uncharacterized protein n=1 Tax=Luteolibacter arcticus TaxID=1581411 RepID=A0ABT3GEA8_9BACT|nr:hypothetical protein [Luteolibacter arcticus]MCW1921955.1 hypothetical protein [Luteolibacter arcticus]
MIRPWYRSRLFWFGLFWQLFLVWAWGDAGAYRSVFSWGQADTAMWVGQDEGSIVVGNLRSTEFHVGDFLGCSDGLELERRPTVTERGRLVWKLPAAFRHEREKSSLGLSGTLKFQSRRLHVAWWVVVGISVAAWSGLMVWWQFRQARALKLATTPLP